MTLITIAFDINLAHTSRSNDFFPIGIRRRRRPFLMTLSARQSDCTVPLPPRLFGHAPWRLAAVIIGGSGGSPGSLFFRASALDGKSIPGPLMSHNSLLLLRQWRMPWLRFTENSERAEVFWVVTFRGNKKTLCEGGNFLVSYHRRRKLPENWVIDFGRCILKIALEMKELISL